MIIGIGCDVVRIERMQKIVPIPDGEYSDDAGAGLGCNCK